MNEASNMTTQHPVREAACKAWCGLPHYDNRVPVAVPFFVDEYGNPDRAWCSTACRDARVPPLESKPAEMGELHDRVHRAMGVARAAKSVRVLPPKEPVCIDCGNGPAIMRFVGKLSTPRPWCEGCYLRYEDGVGDSRKPYAGPERIVRNPVDWIWDTLPDGGR